MEWVAELLPLVSWAICRYGFLRTARREPGLAPPGYGLTQRARPMLPPPTPTPALRSRPAMPDLTALFALRQTGAFEILPGRMRGGSARGVEITTTARVPYFRYRP
jgi:hypothetical protein